MEARTFVPTTLTDASKAMRLLEDGRVLGVYFSQPTG
jgi:hypothetical protein